MAVHVPGLIAILVFYAIILAIGIWAARKTGFKTKGLKIEDTMLANRSLGYLVGVFTITATWVGGGYINGSAEITAKFGLVWCQAPVGFSISLLFGGIFFVEKMRTSGFTTMLDPFHWKFGSLMNCLLYLPALTGDVFWSGAILAALGATLKVILDISLETAIIISAAISVLYTLIGGLYSVAYTDVIQLILMFIGLWLCIPFAMTHEATVDISTNSTEVWIGKLSYREVGLYMDYALLLIFGGIPWQVYWQRVLAAKTVKVGMVLSAIGAFGCIIMAIPAVLMGAIASSTDWNMTGYGEPKISDDDSSLTLPLVMKHLCPPVVTFIGLGAVSAAVMSSTDSSILSSSSMFSRNVFSVVYALITKRKPSETLQVWVMRLAQIVIGVLACLLAITVKSVYSLFLLCADLVYVLIFPQMVCVLYMKKANSYGSLLGFIIGLLIRILGGDFELNIPAVIAFPWYVEKTNHQDFPYRTLAMLVSLYCIIVVSYLTDYIFTRGVLSMSWDIYGCFKDSEKEAARLYRLENSNVNTNPVESESKKKEMSCGSPKQPTNKGINEKNSITKL